MPMSTIVANALRLTVAALAIMWTVPSPAWAQWEPYPVEECAADRRRQGGFDGAPAAHADGKIDLSGFWVPTWPSSTC